MPKSVKKKPISKFTIVWTAIAAGILAIPAWNIVSELGEDLGDTVMRTGHRYFDHYNHIFVKKVQGGPSDCVNPIEVTLRSKAIEVCWFDTQSINFRYGANVKVYVSSSKGIIAEGPFPPSSTIASDIADVLRAHSFTDMAFPYYRVTQSEPIFQSLNAFADKILRQSEISSAKTPFKDANGEVTLHTGEKIDAIIITNKSRKCLTAAHLRYNEADWVSFEEGLQETPPMPGIHIFGVGHFPAWDVARDQAKEVLRNSSFVIRQGGLIDPDVVQKARDFAGRLDELLSCPVPG